MIIKKIISIVLILANLPYNVMAGDFYCLAPSTSITMENNPLSPNPFCPLPFNETWIYEDKSGEISFGEDSVIKNVIRNISHWRESNKFHGFAPSDYDLKKISLFLLKIRQNISLDSLVDQLKSNDNYSLLMNYVRNTFGADQSDSVSILTLATAMAFEEFIGNSADALPLVKTAEGNQGETLGNVFPEAVQVIKEFTRDVFPWAMTPQKNPDKLLDIVTDLKKHKYFTKEEISNSGLSAKKADQIQSVLSETLKWLHDSGLVKKRDISIVLVSNPDHGGYIPERAGKSGVLYVDINMLKSLTKGKKDFVLDKKGINDLRVKILYDLILTSVPSEAEGVSGYESEIIKKSIAFNYIAELCSSGVLNAPENPELLFPVPEHLRQEHKEKFLKIIEQARTSIYYSLRLTEIMLFAAGFHMPYELKEEISELKLLDIFKSRLSDIKAVYYIPSLIRSGCKSLMDKSDKMQKQIDAFFGKSRAKNKELSLWERFWEFTKESFKEKIEGYWELIKSIFSKDPFIIFKKMWRIGKMVGGTRFAIFFIIYQSFEDYILAPLLLYFGLHALATFTFWFHGEAIVILLYVGIRHLIRNTRFKYWIPRKETQNIDQLYKEAEKDDLNSHLEKALSLYTWNRDPALWYFVRILEEKDTPEDSARLDKFSRKELALKIIGRILGKKKRFETSDLDIIENFLIPATEHPDEWVRRSAASALGNVIARLDSALKLKVLRRLQDLLKDKSKIVRSTACWAIQNEPRPQVQVIWDILRILDNKDEDLWTRHYAAKAIGEILRNLNITEDLALIYPDTHPEPEKRFTSLTDVLCRYASAGAHNSVLRYACIEALGSINYATEEMMSCIREAVFDAVNPTLNEIAFWAYVRKSLTTEGIRNIQELKNTLILYSSSHNANISYFCRRITKYLVSLPVTPGIKSELMSFLDELKKISSKKKKDTKTNFIFICLDDLLANDEEKPILNPREHPQIKALRHALRRNQCSVYYASNWRVDRSAAKIKDDGTMDVLENLDTEDFKSVYKALKEGRTAFTPVLDPDRGKRVIEFTAVPGGTHVVMGFRDEIQTLKESLPDSDTVPVIDGFGDKKNKRDDLVSKINKMTNNYPAIERNRVLKLLGKESFWTYSRQFQSISAMKDDLAEKLKEQPNVQIIECRGRLYLVGLHHVTVFSDVDLLSHKGKIETMRLLEKAQEISSRISMDRVMNDRCVTYLLTDSMKQALDSMFQLEQIRVTSPASFSTEDAAA